jgi:ATP-dependent Lon protease
MTMNVKDPGKVTDLIAAHLNLSSEETQDLLNTLDVRVRLEKLAAILLGEREITKQLGTR